MEFFLLVLLLGLIPAAIANNKGRSFLGWWIYGSLIFIVALPHALITEPRQEELEKRKLRRGNKKCPYCAELIKEEAIVCRYCGRDLPDQAENSTKRERDGVADDRMAESRDQVRQERNPNTLLAAGAIAFLLVLFVMMITAIV